MIQKSHAYSKSTPVASYSNLSLGVPSPLLQQPSNPQKPSTKVYVFSLYFTIKEYSITVYCRLNVGQLVNSLKKVRIQCSSSISNYKKIKELRIILFSIFCKDNDCSHPIQLLLTLVKYHLFFSLQLCFVWLDFRNRGFVNASGTRYPN